MDDYVSNNSLHQHPDETPERLLLIQPLVVFNLIRNNN